MKAPLDPPAVARVLTQQRALLPVAVDRDGVRRVAECHLCLGCGAPARNATHLTVEGEPNRWADLCHDCHVDLRLYLMASGGTLAIPN